MKTETQDCDLLFPVLGEVGWRARFSVENAGRPSQEEPCTLGLIE